MFSGEPGRDWEAEATRKSRMVFIGKHLNSEALIQGFKDCVAAPA